MHIGRVRSVHRYPVKSMSGESLARSEVSLDGLLGDRAYAVRDDKAGEIRSARKWPRLLQLAARYRDEGTPTDGSAALITLPDGSELASDAPDVSQRLSAWLGQPATLCPREPASNKDHYRRVNPGAALASRLARAGGLRKIVARLATVGPNGDDIRQEFGRLPGEPIPDLAKFPTDFYAYVSPPGTYFDLYPIHLITTASLSALHARQPEADWDARRFRANFVVETSDELSGLVEQDWVGRTVRIGDVEIECTIPTPRCSIVTQPQVGMGRDLSVLRTIVREAAQDVGVYARVVRGGSVAVGDMVTLG